MGEGIITRRGGTILKMSLPVLNDSYPQDVNLITINEETKSATFVVQIETPGVPAKYSYQWYENGNIIAGATTSVYTKTNLNVTGTYTYYCEVVSSAGTVTTRIATLQVTKYAVPVLNENYPADVTQVESVDGNATFSLQISADGIPAEYTYQWYVDNIAVEGATSYTFVKTGLITPATYSIYCKVTNAAGTVQSRTAILTITSFKPVYTYSGTAEFIDEENKNWKIKFLTSGVLNFASLGTGNGNIDIFCVGGGGGGGLHGGGGGYTETAKNQTINLGQDYTITVGAGGTSSGSKRGGTSSFDTLASVEGGYGGYSDGNRGGDGGSGGGAYGNETYSGNGGSNGSNGGGSGWDSQAYGKGQGTTTREFGETTGTLYAGGGAGGAKINTNNPYGYGGEGGGGHGSHRGNNWQAWATAGETNTGGGGGGGDDVEPSRAGGSGIVIIRNKR